MQRTECRDRDGTERCTLQQGEYDAAAEEARRGVSREPKPRLRFRPAAALDSTARVYVASTDSARNNKAYRRDLSEAALIPADMRSPSRASVTRPRSAVASPLSNRNNLNNIVLFERYPSRDYYKSHGVFFQRNWLNDLSAVFYISKRMNIRRNCIANLFIRANRKAPLPKQMVYNGSLCLLVH